MSENLFQINGYQIVRGFIDPEELFAYSQELINNNQGVSDSWIEGAKIFYKFPKFEKLLEDMIPKMEGISGKKLFKTYSFARIYQKDNILRSHRDRPSCEISATICLGYDGEPWPIWVNDREEKATRFVLEPGDALIYKGIEIPHWREKNIYGPCSQLFLHYVDQQGIHAHLKNDKVRGVHFNLNFFKMNLNFTLQRVK